MSFQEFIRKAESAKNIFVFSGAGMSTNSGLPDYRSSNGLWKNKRFEQIMNRHGLFNHPDEFHDLVRFKVEKMLANEPNKGHKALSYMQSRLNMTIATQNVDGYDKIAGSQVMELHGTLREFYCAKCGFASSLEKYMGTNGHICESCKKPRVRPRVTLFGEDLPKGIMKKASMASRRADMTIALGSTMQVYPAAGLFVVNSDSDKIIVNKGPTELDHCADHKFDVDLSEFLTDMAKHF